MDGKKSNTLNDSCLRKTEEKPLSRHNRKAVAALLALCGVLFANKILYNEVNGESNHFRGCKRFHLESGNNWTIAGLPISSIMREGNYFAGANWHNFP